MRVPIGISNRHVHLSQADANTLFGSNYQLTPIKDLSQPGQYACEETVTIKGEKGEIGKVRILGPYRKFSQLEIMLGDTFKLGTSAPVRESGKLEGSAPVTLVGPKGEVHLTQGMIVAKRHIHMSVADAENFGVQDGQIVKVKTNGERSVIFNEVFIRVNDSYALDMHIDVEEGNAAGLKQGDWGELILE